MFTLYKCQSCQCLVLFVLCTFEMKKHKTRVALNTGYFYLASESPRGENGHILCIPYLLVPGASLWGRAGGWGRILPKVLELLRTDSLIEPEVQTPASPADPPPPPHPLVPLVPCHRAAAFSSDKCTSEWQNHKRGKTKKSCCIRVPSFGTRMQNRWRSRPTGRSSHVSIIPTSVRGGADGWIQIQVDDPFSNSIHSPLYLTIIPNSWSVKKIRISTVKSSDYAG